MFIVYVHTYCRVSFLLSSSSPPRMLPSCITSTFSPLNFTTCCYLLLLLHRTIAQSPRLELNHSLCTHLVQDAIPALAASDWVNGLDCVLLTARTANVHDGLHGINLCCTVHGELVHKGRGGNRSGGAKRAKGRSQKGSLRLLSLTKKISRCCFLSV